MQVTRPEQLQIGAASVATRNPVALWILSFATLGIWCVVWAYQVNRELRDYSSAVQRPFQNFPSLAAVLVALWPLAFIPGMISVFLTGRRVRTTQEWVGIDARVNALVATILFPLLFLQTFYLQRALNDVWKAAAHGKGPEPDYTVSAGQEAQLDQQTRLETEQRLDRWR